MTAVDNWELSKPPPKASAACFRLISDVLGPPGPPSMRFELDLNYGASTVCPPPLPKTPPWWLSVRRLDGENITTHRIRKDSFRIEGDGNRIEVATDFFPVTAEGRRRMITTMRRVVALADDLRRRCSAAPPDKALGYPAAAGSPRHFVAPFLEPPAACLFPLGLRGKQGPYFGESCGVAASPQAALELPLGRVDRLVSLIKRSEVHGVAGAAWSGPRSDRQGDRSDALYDAQRAVNESRARHIRARTPLPNGEVVTGASYSPALQGLMILLVSYLRTSELAVDPRDWEVFPKAYLPLNVKNPFRLLYQDLSPTEVMVFRTLYGDDRIKLWTLAKPGATGGEASNELFPAKARKMQLDYFHSIPTWGDLIDKTMTNTPLVRTRHPPLRGWAPKKGEGVGCEVLFAPLSRIHTYQPGSRRVAVEMRRLGFNWVFSHGFTSRSGVRHPGWTEMARGLFDLAFELNR